MLQSCLFTCMNKVNIAWIFLQWENSFLNITGFIVVVVLDETSQQRMIKWSIFDSTCQDGMCYFSPWNIGGISIFDIIWMFSFVFFPYCIFYPYFYRYIFYIKYLSDFPKFRKIIQSIFFSLLDSRNIYYLPIWIVYK